MVNEAIKRIEEQQKKHDKFSPVYQVGEQLKDICRESPEEAELILRDLDNKDMSIVAAEKRIKAFADSHKKGNCACVPWQEADRILREFYGLSPKRFGIDSAAPKTDSGTINLADFM